MAKSKSIFTAWYCKDCNKMGYTSKYIKSAEGVLTKKVKFCSKCKKRTEHGKKDIKKSN